MAAQPSLETSTRQGGGVHHHKKSCVYPPLFILSNGLGPLSCKASLFGSLGVVSVLNYTENLEQKGKIHWRKFKNLPSWPK